MRIQFFTCVAAIALLGASAVCGQVQQPATRPSAAGASFQDTDDLPAVETDTSKATPARVSELRQRAEGGDALAQNNLAYLYTYGQGVPQDYQEAAKWYAASAAQGCRPRST